MADKNDDIKHLFEHLGLDPTDYHELKGPTKVVESARRWSLLGEVSEHPPRAAEIPEQRRQIVAQLSAANRAQRIASIRSDDASGRAGAESDRSDSAESTAPRQERPAAESTGRLPPTVTWASDESDDEDQLPTAETPSSHDVAGGEDAPFAPAMEFDDERQAAGADDAASIASDELDVSQATAAAARTSGTDPSDDDDAEEAQAAREAIAAAAARRAEKARDATAVPEERRTEINPLGAFADSIGAPPEPVASATDAGARRTAKPQPRSAPRRSAPTTADVSEEQLHSRSERAKVDPNSRTGEALKGLLAASQKVRTADTGDRSRRAVAPKAANRVAPQLAETEARSAPPPAATQAVAGESPASASTQRAEPVADAPTTERRQHDREDFESAIEAVAQAAKAEVRRRVEDERKALRDEALAEPVAASAEPATAPKDRRPDREAAAVVEAPQETAARVPVKPSAGVEQAEQRSQQPTAGVDQARGMDQRMAPVAESAAAATRQAPPSSAAKESRSPDRQSGSGSDQRALPASGRHGPSPLRKLREAKPPASAPVADERETPGQQSGRLSDTFRRLQSPEKPAISASGKLRLNYGQRSGSHGVRTSEPETINEIFDRLRRNRRPGEPRK